MDYHGLSHCHSAAGDGDVVDAAQPPGAADQSTVRQSPDADVIRVEGAAALDQRRLAYFDPIVLTIDQGGAVPPPAPVVRVDTPNPLRARVMRRTREDKKLVRVVRVAQARANNIPVVVEARPRVAGRGAGVLRGRPHRTDRWQRWGVRAEGAARHLPAVSDAGE